MLTATRACNAANRFVVFVLEVVPMSVLLAFRP
jgi:hypothetical protein